MILILSQKISEQEKTQIAEDLGGYIKVVIDLQKQILTAGGKRHVEGEQLLLSQGSKQEDLWGGGLDVTSGEIDFDSMINIRPNQGNPSREVLDKNIREQMEVMIKKIFL